MKTFITGAKVPVNQNVTVKKPESPTSKAARALAVLNGEAPSLALVKKDSSDSNNSSDEEKDKVLAIMSQSRKNLEDEALDEVSALEQEMNLMYKELDDM